MGISFPIDYEEVTNLTRLSQNSNLCQLMEDRTFHHLNESPSFLMRAPYWLPGNDQLN